VNADEDESGGFKWDAAKSEATLAQRGFDFAFAARLFARDHIVREDLRNPYGERRYTATGEVEDRVITVVWTPRGGRRRIVSAWPASNRERREYREYRQAIERGDANGEGSHRR
jgi:uncharacterized DUF497 family protein